MHVIVCGGGAIGAAITYYLSRQDIAVTLVEREGIACAASGKSGGFLALDWCDGSPVEALARRSFALHAELAEEIDEDYGYRRMTTYSGYAAPGEPESGFLSPYRLDWTSDDTALTRQLGTEQTTAQVHPAGFTKALVRASESRGATVAQATVEGILQSADGTVTGIRAGGEEIDGDAVVIAMGPWSVLASAWLSLPAIYGLKGHSLVFRDSRSTPADALFIDYRDDTGAAYSPEVFPRADGTVYVCGVSDESPLPVDPADVAPDPNAIAQLEKMCAAMAPGLAADAVIARQACFRPVTQDGLPVIGPVPGAANAYVATGHSVWGILNAPATGEAVAEVIATGRSTIDLSPFDPGRLPAFDASLLRTGAG